MTGQSPDRPFRSLMTSEETNSNICTLNDIANLAGSDVRRTTAEKPFSLPMRFAFTQGRKDFEMETKSNDRNT